MENTTIVILMAVVLVIGIFIGSFLAPTGNLTINNTTKNNTTLSNNPNEKQSSNGFNQSSNNTTNITNSSGD